MNKQDNIDYPSILNQYEDEELVSEQLGITMEELYSNVDYKYGSNIAREILKHYCRSCANGVCFSWPLVDEKYCPVNGLETKCPLAK